jgi:hypothetical protein
MKKYLLGLALTGAASRLSKYAGAAIARKNPGGGMRNLLIGAAVGVGLTWLLEQRKKQ